MSRAFIGFRREPRTKAPVDTGHFQFPLLVQLLSCDPIDQNTLAAYAETYGVPSMRRLDGIQWLRAIAAGLVVVEHTKNAISTTYFNLKPVDSPLSIFPFSAGVDLFFVISGFIMSYSSASLFAQTGGRRVFLLRRVARIVPLYWLMTSFMLVAFVLRDSVAWTAASWWSVIASYLFFPAINADGVVSPLFVVGWTLNYEMAFYVVFALFIGFREQIALTLTAATMMAIVVVGLLVVPGALPLQFWANPIILEFVAGIGLYGLYRAGLLGFGPTMQFVLVSGAIGVLALHSADPGLWRSVVWGMPAVALVAAALAWDEAAEAPTQRSLGDLAGDMSYAVYLVHLPVIVIATPVVRAVMPAEIWVWMGLFPALVAAGTLAIAALLHFAVERPIQRAARRVSLPAANPRGSWKPYASRSG